MDTLSASDSPLPAKSVRPRFRRAFALAGVALPLVFALESGARPEQAAAVRPSQNASLPAPQPVEPDVLGQALAGAHYGLSQRDHDAYARAFSAAERGDWTGADTALGVVTDRRLAGHVTAVRYLAAGTDPSYAELRGWLDLYRDLPQASDIYRIAEARRPRGASPLPAVHNAIATREEPGDPEAQGIAEPKTAAGDRALSRFFVADDKGALAEALRAIGTLGARATSSHWVAGLASWRLGQLEEAARHFAALAGARKASGWLQAAGAYWAGRVDEQRGIGASASKWFGNASRFPTTFYGILAMRKLDANIARQASADSLTSSHLDLIAQTPAGYRAVALLQLGQRGLAAKELERIDATGNPKLEEAIAVVAQAAKLGDMSGNLANRIARPVDDSHNDLPIPAWRPKGGFRVDPALVFAVARQESRFDPKALSPSGAAGLMQIMPGTARLMAPQHTSLFDPATNLDIGQRYLRTLMHDPNIGGNLLLLAVAYNKGSSNPGEFRRILDRGDPLLAVESIPASGERNFIKRVLANYWLYKARLGGDTASLTDLANGQWPVYRWRSANDDRADSLNLVED
jgi:soluble lytic murein transglycosylase-like protein